MKTHQSILVLAYGVVLAGLGLLANWTDPQIARLVMIAGGAGGALCMLWGILGLLGRRCRGWFFLTIVPLSFAFLPQAVAGWMRPDEAKSGSFLGTIVITMLFLASVGLLIYVLHFGESSPDDIIGKQPQPGNMDRAGGSVPAVASASRPAASANVRKAP